MVRSVKLLISEAARAFRDDGAQDSDIVLPRADASLAVQSVNNVIELSLGNVSEICPFGEVSPKQSIGVFVGGKWKYLFRAVDKQGRLIDFMLSDRRNTKAARRFLAKVLKVMRNWPPVSITTDKLGSYPKALRRLKRKGELKDTVKHRTSKYLNNRIRPIMVRQTADPSHKGLPVDEDRLRHDQGLRDHAHDPTPPLHPDRTQGHRRSAFRQQTLRSRRLIRAAERARFYSTAVNATASFRWVLITSSSDTAFSPVRIRN
jgi:DDE domain